MVKEIAGYIVAPMWHDIMAYALTKYPQEFFTAPQPIPDDVPGALRGLYSDGVNAHDILYWVNKNDPRSGGNSWSDGQFPYWEYPINAGITGAGSTTVATSTASTTPQTITTSNDTRDQTQPDVNQ